MRFRDLTIGQVFEFESDSLGMEHGPWEKVSARCYIKHTTPFGTDAEADTHQEWHGLKCEVGTINVKVTPQGTATNL